MSSRMQPGRRAFRGRSVQLVAAALVIVAFGCGADDDTTSVRSDLPAEITHVHGLGVNPADGRLYVATHFGLFVVDEDGTARRVGERAQDTMGFAVAGADHFLASGHPDFGNDEDAHPFMGFIESTDAGKTWTTRSLEGEADFHALAVANEQVYGWNASTGEFMASPDGSQWERRSTVALFSFAVDPQDPDHVVASGERGLLRSRDGGRLWQDEAGPAIAYLSWSPNGQLWAAGRDGRAQMSDDAGSTWAERAPLASGAAALLALDDTVYAATGAAQIVRWSDADQNWTAVWPL